MPSHRVIVEKNERTKEVRELIDRYNVIGIASLEKVRANQLQELRRKLENKAYLHVIKNSTIQRAIRECEDKPELKDLEKHLKGPNIFLFTDLNPFELALLLKRNTVEAIARGGDTAAHDVVVPSGNTGLPPGPIISQLSAVGLPSRIESGSVWISRDTVVAEKGEIIDARLASVLSKLDIKSVEVGLAMNIVYDDGTVITEEQLYLDPEEIRFMVEEAYNQAFNLSLNTTYPNPTNINTLLQIAYLKAYSLSLNSQVLAPHTVTAFIRKAHLAMLSLSKRVNWSSK